MLWNELSYDLQLIILEKFSDSLTNEEDEEIIDAVMAAVNELLVWSNSPCEIYDEFDKETDFK
jgi:hypothetical protein